MSKRDENLDEQGAVWTTLGDFALPSVAGNERRVMELVCVLIQPLKLSPAKAERVKTAVAEAALNAIEHGNNYRRDLPVQIDVAASQRALRIRITDQGASGKQPVAEEPDLNAKLAETQSPRGWGLFLIKSMVDAMRIHESHDRHTIELVFNLETMNEGGSDADDA